MQRAAGVFRFTALFPSLTSFAAEAAQTVPFPELWQQHRMWALALAVLLSSLVGALARLGWQRRALRLTEQKLRREKQHLADVIWGTNVGTWEWNVQTGEVVINERWAEIVGYRLDEL